MFKKNTKQKDGKSS